MRLWPMLVFGVSTAALAQTSSAPGGAGCSGALARYRAVQSNDLAMGHVAKSVHDQIAREIADADKVCQAGQDAKALSMIRASEIRHGYPTSL